MRNFWGNAQAVTTLRQMIDRERIPQTLIFAGQGGLGKATLARRFGQELLDHPEKIEHDDLSLPDNVAMIQEREKLAAEKRNDDPLVFATHPDFLTFPPDGPLRQISIPQMRLLKERAQFKPLHGNRRIFLIDHLDRANEQAANSLLKTLEEPPEHLILVATVENMYDLLPTIRSRAVILSFSALSNEEMRDFAKAHQLQEAEKRIALSGGSPGYALSLDIAAYEKRRGAMHTLLKAAAGEAGFNAWLPVSETIGRSKSEKLEFHLTMLYGLLRDLMILRESGGDIRNSDLRGELTALANRVTTRWIIAAVKKVDEIAELLRRNIQKTIALDDMIIELRQL
ncbi:MAG TPA: DNA polymerase III subunit delta' [Bryobacteraceae bacterium]|jgi:DNA polymerase-3 subunit delta'